jgi:hypothetical protein
MWSNNLWEILRVYLGWIWLFRPANQWYILVGYTKSFGNGNEDIYLIKTDSEGLLTDINNDHIDDQPESVIFPNPNHGDFMISLPIGRNEFQIINQQGQMVYTKNFKTEISDSHAQIELAKLPKGLYVLRIILDSRKIMSEKLIIYWPFRKSSSSLLGKQLEIMMFNLTGNLIATIFNGRIDKTTINWTPGNDQSQIRPGVYLMKLKSGSLVNETIKVIKI